MTRIALLVVRFPVLSETFIVSQFIGLLERGYDVHIVCQHCDDREARHFPALAAIPGWRRRVHVIARTPVRMLARSGVLAGWVLRSPRRAGSALLRAMPRGPRGIKNLVLDEVLLRLRPDIVHADFGTLAPATVARLRRQIGCRTSVSFRGFDIEFAGLEDPDYYTDVWPAVDAIHVLGEGIAQRCRQRGCPPSARMVAIPPSIDTKKFDPGDRTHTGFAGSTERPLRILSVGRLAWKKGHDWGLQAMAELQARGVHCQHTIIGDGDARGEIAFLRHQLGLESIVDLAGTVSPDAIPEAMGQADVLLHPSVSEGFGNAVLEAQAMKLPVVSSDAAGLAQNIEHNVTGVVTPRRDVQALADGLELMRDPQRREQFGTAGRARVCAQFTLEQYVDRWDRFFRELTEPDPGA